MCRRPGREYVRGSATDWVRVCYEQGVRFLEPFSRDESGGTCPGTGAVDRGGESSTDTVYRVVLRSCWESGRHLISGKLAANSISTGSTTVGSCLSTPILSSALNRPPRVVKGSVGRAGVIRVVGSWRTRVVAGPGGRVLWLLLAIPFHRRAGAFTRCTA